MDEQQVNEYLKGAVEALLFISDKPVEIDQIKEAIKTVGTGEIKQLIKMLQKDYEENDRGMMIREIAGGYQMLSNPQYAEFVRNFFKTRVKEKLSRPALEALSITAYRQPVSRADIEMIRGVNSDGVVTNLLEKGLVKIVGRKDVPGRPFIYGTTKLFLEYFGLKSLKDLPKLEDVTELLGARAGEEGDEAAGSELFGSNKVLSVEEAVSDFGGDDHLTQSFAREGSAEMFEEEETEEGEASQAEEASEASEDTAPIKEESFENDGAEKIEEAEDLKKAMQELSRDGSDEVVGESLEEVSEIETVEANSVMDEEI